jgi:acyl carrier protein
MKLDYFILFSTLVTLIGNAGQGNYVAANAFMEGLARRRRQDGLPALAIGWGPITDVGVLVRNNLLESSVDKLSGVRGMTAREGLELMAQVLAQPADDIDLAVVTIAPSESGFAVLRSPTYAALSHGGERSQAEDERVDVLELLDTVGLAGARRGVADAIVMQLAHVLHARPEDVSRARPLGEIGLDSLMALELTVSLETTFGAYVSLVGTGGHATVLEIADEIIAQVGRASAHDDSHATALAERHMNEVDAVTVDMIKDALAADTPQEKTSPLGIKRATSG